MICLISGLGILRHLTDMSRLTTDAFRYLFFDSDEYARRSGIETENDQDKEIQMDGVNPIECKRRKNEYDTSPMTRRLQRKINSRLNDWISFIEVKAQRNLTMSLCVVLFDRTQDDDQILF
jgi:hypothetical protein